MDSDSEQHISGQLSQSKYEVNISQKKIYEVNNKFFVEEFEHQLTISEIITSHEDAYLLYCQSNRIKRFK